MMTVVGFVGLVVFVVFSSLAGLLLAVWEGVVMFGARMVGLGVTTEAISSLLVLY